MTILAVIPTNGRVAFLEEAISSILAQTLLPNELLIVSSGARGPVENVVERFTDPICKISVVYNKTNFTTAGGNRNIALDYLPDGTDFLAFLDDDDIWRPEYLESMQAAALGTNWAVSWGEFISQHGVRPGPSILSNVEWTTALGQNPGMTGSNFIIHQDAFRLVGGFDPLLRVSNDRDLLIRLLQAGLEYSVVKKPLMVQRIHDSGQLTNRTLQRAAGLEAFMKKYQRDFSPTAKRHFNREISSVLRVASPKLRIRLFHTFRQAALYTPGELFETIARRARGAGTYK